MWTTNNKCLCDKCGDEIKIGDKYYTMFFHSAHNVHEKCFLSWAIDYHGASLDAMGTYEDEESDDIL